MIYYSKTTLYSLRNFHRINALCYADTLSTTIQISKLCKDSRIYYLFIYYRIIELYLYLS